MKLRQRMRNGVAVPVSRFVAGQGRRVMQRLDHVRPADRHGEALKTVSLRSHGVSTLRRRFRDADYWRVIPTSVG
jgi:hypothetical protein